MKLSGNNVNSFINQQTGFGLWKDCDTSFKRLICTKKDSFTQLTPLREDNDLLSDTPIFSCKFASKLNNEHIAALANEDGKLAIHDFNANKRYGSQAHNNAIFDLAWMFDRMKLVTASGDHTSKLYDVSEGDLRQDRLFCGHTRSVKTVAFRKDDSSIFATGGRDGNIILWDIRTDTSSFIGKADRTISNSHLTRTIITPNKSRRKFGTPTNSGIKSVTGLVFQEGDTLISCGAGDGLIKIWDLRKNYSIYKRESTPKDIIPFPGATTKNGYSSLLIDNTGMRLYANCLDNTIYCFNMSSYNHEPIMKYVGHQNSTFYVKSALCKNGEYIISGSSDESAYIWNAKRSYPLVKLTGHTAEVTCVAWCDKNNLLITCSDDMSHMIWTIGPEHLLPEDGLRGRAEIVCLEQFSKMTSLKRALDEMEESTPKKFITECRKCTNPTVFCENCFVSSKRKNTGDFQRENKIIRTEFGPRRLFANITSISQNEKTETLANSLELDEEHLTTLDVVHSPKRARFQERSPSVVSGPSYSNREDNEPQKKIAKLEMSPTQAQFIRSPTINLPNYILDGVAPHLHYSPPKKKGHDWLTKLRTEKMLRQEMIDRTIGDSQKYSRLDNTPKSKRYAPKSPLLRYFKVTNSAHKCDGISCSKHHNCSSYGSPGLRPNDN